jgi:hypothetical protein
MRRLWATILPNTLWLVRHDDGRTRTAALATTSFAIVGFLVGLNFTVRGGDAPDVAYHLVMLPILVVTLFFIARRRSPAVNAEQPTQ